MGVAGGPVEPQRQDALGYRQHAIAGPLRQGQARRRDRAQQRQPGGPGRVHQGGDPGGHQRIDPAQDGELQEPHRHGRQAEQPRGRGRLRDAEAEGVQQSRQVGADAGGDEPGAGEQHRHLHHRPVPAELGRRRRGGVVSDRPPLRRRPGGQRQADEELQGRPGQTGAAPAVMRLQPAGERPADAGAQAAQQGDGGDRPARAPAIQLHQDGEGRGREAQGHAEPDHQHAGGQGDAVAGDAGQGEARGEDHMRGQQRVATPAGVQPAGDAGGDHGRDGQ